MNKDELIKILEEYEMFVDDDFGGSYESIIAYAPNKTISRAHTPIAVLNIIDTFEKIQQENQKYKEVIEKVINKLETDIEFCKNDSQGVYDLCNIAIAREKKILNILKEVEHDS